MDTNNQALVLEEIAKLAAMTANGFSSIESRMATKDELKSLRDELKGDILSMKGELKYELYEIRSEMKNGFAIMDSLLTRVDMLEAASA